MKQFASLFSGVGYTIAASVIFTTTTFLFKSTSIDIANAMILRLATQACIFGIYAKYYRKYSLLQCNGRRLSAIFNIITSSGTNMAYICALYFLPLSDVNAIKYTYMVWTTIIGVYFFGEPFSFVIVFSTCITVIGLILMTKPELFVSISIQRSSRLITNSVSTSL